MALIGRSQDWDLHLPQGGHPCAAAALVDFRRAWRCRTGDHDRQPSAALRVL